MPTKTWKEKFDEEYTFTSNNGQKYLKFDYRYINPDDEDDEGWYVSSSKIKQFISDLRKQDEEELIKMLPSHDDMMDEGCLEAIDKFSKNLKDYYENN